MRPRSGSSAAVKRRLEGGEGELVDAQRAGQRVPAQPLDDRGVAEHQAGLRPAEQLVAAAGDDGGAGAQRGCGVGLVGQQRVRGEQAAADVGDHRDAQRRPARATSTLLVNPSTRKLLGCTLRMQPVSGPIARA